MVNTVVAGSRADFRNMERLLIFVLYLTCTQIQGHQDYDIIFPERVHNTRLKRDLSTNTEDGHEDSVTFALKAFNKHFVMDAKRNDRLIPQSFVVRQFDSNDAEVISRDSPDGCHYQGSIRGHPDSVVVLNTCNGLSGIIDDGKTTYNIEPHDNFKDTGAHKIYPAKDDEKFDSDLHCGTENDESTIGSKDSKIRKTVKRLRRSIGHVVNMEEVYRPYLTTSETRYTEVLFVVSNGMYQRYDNNSRTVIEKVATLCNAVDAVYQRINVRVVMSAIEIWSNGDRMERQATGGAELGTFGTYRKQKLIGKIHHDNAQFLSEHGWGNVAGMAWVGTMCGSLSAAVNAWSFGGITGPLVTVAHEMGHNFGYNHNTGDCKCLTPKGCFMGGHKTRVPGFSDCNLNSMKRINDKCLYNVPTQAINARCGNGIREGDEECDCGTPEMCKKKDPCCLPHKCQLRPSAMCSDLHHSCCKGCQYKKQGTLCRASQTDCDVPEYCPGNSRDCPADAVMQDGIPCNRTMKLILANTNRYSVVRRKLSPRIEARYLRINPQYWNGWICMRTDLLGCPADKVNPTAPTPLKPYNDYCIVPKNETCVPHENSKIVFRSGSECKKNYMEFKLDANRTLWHECSKRRVCPEKGQTWNGVRLVISSDCKDEDSKFVRTSGHSLKHVKSGKCIHPYGAWPGDNVELVLWGGCDITRLEIWFIKPDCLVPLGIRSNAIPDSQITASSTRGSELPKYARLHNSRYWCAAEKKKSEYLQIDLGKTETISNILTQGRGNWYYWVTAYHLYYSQDGVRWTGYSESGDAAHSNSNCFQGKCAETRDTQCRNLWGADTHNAVQGCYDKLNTEAKGFGTCDPFSNSSCAAKDVQCGQIQCLSKLSAPVVNYGKSYSKIAIDDSTQCSGAVLSSNKDNVGNGMVNEGTKCGDKKMCSNFQCKTFDELNITKCKSVDGKVCNGRGVCTSSGVCHCYEDYEPKSGCKDALVAQNGGFSKWSEWSICTAGCNGGKQTRHRFCNNPFPMYGGKDCQGDLQEEQECNTQACPKAHSCRHLQLISTSNNKPLPDGIYDIFPRGMSSAPIKAYCDMSRDGGGWTLLVTSHTNSWTSDNVRLRNEGTPSLINDYSILKHADDIKNNLNVIGGTFEYRLEAQKPGRWGGIWKADRSYTFTASNNGQTNVELVKKFDNWEYKDGGIEKRMPWISGAKLTTSSSPSRNWWGTITANDNNYHPAPWISGHLMESQPEHIWYWMREGPWELPRSCMEIQMRGYQTTPNKDGVYTIKPPGKQPVKTYCDLTSRGGGWTLLVTSKTHKGWTADNVRTRNVDNPSLDSDYSILNVADAIKDFDSSQDFFQYRIEADGLNQYGGIFDSPSENTFTSNCDKQTNVKMVENFNNVGNDTNLSKRMPRLEMSSSIFLSAASTHQDASGSIVYNGDSNSSPTYLPSLKARPGVVRYWMREGTRRSCFDIKVHGVRRGLTFKDGYYMIRLLNASSYLPVFCDMTSDIGAYTLIVTSRHNSWTRAQVPARNVYRPSLNDDYSILKYADLIKNMGHNSTFKYKLDANQRGHWGGVWSAPREYSFMATSSGQTNVQFLQKFSNWDFSWWKGVQNRMPWFDAKGSSTDALLTTSKSTTYYPAGSIIWGNNQYHPAYWIRYSGMMNPGVIWYWVNEDDCDTNRKPVNGRLTQWGKWSKCDALCVEGKQSRKRTCTNPAPKCGGRLCLGKTLQERSCNYCPASTPIRSYGGFCVQPKSGDCNPKENTTTWSHSLIFKKADQNCSADYMKFMIDMDGIIYHKCSGKIVCPQGNWPGYNRKLLLMNSCPKDISRHKRLPSKNLQNIRNNYCVHPSGGWPGENVHLIYYAGCNANRLILDFFQLPPP